MRRIAYGLTAALIAAPAFAQAPTGSPEAQYAAQQAFQIMQLLQANTKLTEQVAALQAQLDAFKKADPVSPGAQKQPTPEHKP